MSFLSWLRAQRDCSHINGKWNNLFKSEFLSFAILHRNAANVVSLTLTCHTHVTQHRQTISDSVNIIRNDVTFERNAREKMKGKPTKLTFSNVKVDKERNYALWALLMEKRSCRNLYGNGMTPNQMKESKNGGTACRNILK